MNDQFYHYNPDAILPIPTKAEAELRYSVKVINSALYGKHAGHTISTGNGPIDRGGWPWAQCTCGWYSTSKDDELVLESLAQHVHDVTGE